MGTLTSETTLFLQHVQELRDEFLSYLLGGKYDKVYTHVFHSLGLHGTHLQHELFCRAYSALESITNQLAEHSKNKYNVLLNIVSTPASLLAHKFEFNRTPKDKLILCVYVDIDFFKTICDARTTERLVRNSDCRCGKFLGMFNSHIALGLLRCIGFTDRWTRGLEIPVHKPIIYDMNGDQGIDFNVKFEGSPSPSSPASYALHPEISGKNVPFALDMDFVPPQFTPIPTRLSKFRQDLVIPPIEPSGTSDVPVHRRAGKVPKMFPEKVELPADDVEVESEMDCQEYAPSPAAPTKSPSRRGYISLPVPGESRAPACLLITAPSACAEALTGQVDASPCLPSPGGIELSAGIEFTSTQTLPYSQQAFCGETPCPSEYSSYGNLPPSQTPQAYSGPKQLIDTDFEIYHVPKSFKFGSTLQLPSAGKSPKSPQVVAPQQTLSPVACIRDSRKFSCVSAVSCEGGGQQVTFSAQSLEQVRVPPRRPSTPCLTRTHRMTESDEALHRLRLMYSWRSRLGVDAEDFTIERQLPPGYTVDALIADVCSYLKFM